METRQVTNQDIQNAVNTIDRVTQEALLTKEQRIEANASLQLIVGVITSLRQKKTEEKKDGKPARRVKKKK